jgi:hypothetical protein
MKLAFAAATFVVFAFSFGSQSTSVSRSIELEVPEGAVVTAAKPVPTTVVPTTTTAATIVTTTSTTTTTTVVPSVADISVVSIESPMITDIEKLICFVGSEWNCGEALAVSWCESWHKPRAVSSPNRDGTRDRGVFQVNDVWEEAWSPQVWANILDLETNVAMAHHIWKTGNDSWLYWTCQP